jgi:hypothetical protein
MSVLFSGYVGKYSQYEVLNPLMDNLYFHAGYKKGIQIIAQAKKSLFYI